MGSQGVSCTCQGTRKEKMKNWRILHYKCNFSAFGGYACQRSDYSQVHCLICKGSWRTRAAYVEKLEHLERSDR